VSFAAQISAATSSSLTNAVAGAEPVFPPHVKSGGAVQVQQSPGSVLPWFEQKPLTLPIDWHASSQFATATCVVTPVWMSRTARVRPVKQLEQSFSHWHPAGICGGIWHVQQSVLSVLRWAWQYPPGAPCAVQYASQLAYCVPLPSVGRQPPQS
jgi:hypothetical protein